ncbi:MAG: AzlC family ABC transporter permease [Dehalococcoidia bacterium]|nr:AzlC family ABC transporter permease [Dehalococcoidia bacterium]
MTTEPAVHAFRDSLRRGVRDAVPLAIAVALFGVSFGVLAKSAGFGGIATVVMSLTTFSGAAQFASVSIIRDGGGAAAAITAAALLSARFIPIGLSVAPVLRGRVPARFAKSQLVIDESWAVASRGGGLFDAGALVGAGLLLYVAWLAGTLVGVAGGGLLSDPEALGLDAAFPALFLALLAPNLRKRRLLVAALLGAGIALVLVPFVRPGLPVVAASLACLVGWSRR